LGIDQTAYFKNSKSYILIQKSSNVGDSSH
jgi:hypothetical protein